MDGLYIKITNFSKMPWNRNNWEVGAGSNNKKNWPDEISQTPSEALRPHSGLTEAHVSSVQFAFLVKDALYMTLGYGSDEGDFAVNAQQLFHFAGIGAQCEWSYWDGGNNAWMDRGTDSTPHTWNFKTCTAIATPTLTNSSASINIMISDHK